MGEHSGALPPGQRVAKRWPVYTEGRVPRFDPASWTLRVWGRVQRPLTLTYDELRGLPRAEVAADLHCVTGWSLLGSTWTGVPVRDVLARAEPEAAALYVMVHGEHGYNANLPLEVLLAPDAVLAWARDGKDLTPDHGFPLRLVTPRAYGWKSVKWVRGLEVLEEDRRGYWEVRGYHNRADPWAGERYSYQE